MCIYALVKQNTQQHVNDINIIRKQLSLTLLFSYSMTTNQYNGYGMTFGSRLTLTGGFSRACGLSVRVVQDNN